MSYLKVALNFTHYLDLDMSLITLAKSGVILVVQEHRFQIKTGFKLQHIIGQLSFSFEDYNFKETLQILISQKSTKVFVHEKYVPGRTLETSNYSQYVNNKYSSKC